MLARLSLIVASAALGLGVALYWPRLNAETQPAAAESPPSPQLPSPAGESIVGLGYVDVEAGVAPLALPAPGVVEAVLVKEGERVAAGQAMVRLRQGRAEALVRKAEAGVAEANVRLKQARRSGDSLALRRSQQEHAIAAAQAQESAAARHLGILRNLSDVAPERVAVAQDQVDAAQAIVKVEKLKLEQLALEQPAEIAETAAAALQGAEADLAAARQLLADHTLAAPSAGVALRVLAVPGQMIGVNPLQPTLWFRPEQPLLVRVEVDQAFADQVAVGMAAEIFDDNRRKRLATGSVRSLAPWIAQRRSQLDEPHQRNDVRTLECLVSINGGDHGLRIGQRLRVAIRALPPTAPATVTSR